MRGSRARRHGSEAVGIAVVVRVRAGDRIGARRYPAQYRTNTTRDEYRTTVRNKSQALRMTLGDFRKEHGHGESIYLA